MPSINQFANIETKGKWVAMKTLSLLTNDLPIGSSFSDEFSGEFAKKFSVGRTIQVPLSQRWNGQRNDMTYRPEAMDRPTTPITTDQTYTLPFEWESIEQALDMERGGEEMVEKNYIRPAIAYARQAVESDLAQFAGQYTNMISGALGTNPGTYDATSAAALQYLSQMGCASGDGDLSLYIPSAVNRVVKATGATYHNPVTAISKQFLTGFVGRSDSFDWFTSQSLYRHTAGTWAGAVTISGGGQSGSSLTVACTTGDTFKKGDKFSIAAVNQVNLMTRVATSTASAGSMTFSITEDATGVASAATLSIFPPIYGPGSHYQNVDALPADAAALTLWPGTTSPSGKIGTLGLAIGPGSFFITGASLQQPKGSVEYCKSYQDSKTGVGIRVLQQYVGERDAMITRLDLLWGRGVGLADQCALVLPCA